MTRNIILSSLTRTRARMLISLILLFLTMTIILFYSAGNHRKSLIDLRKREIRRQVEIALNTIRPYIDGVESGQLSREEGFDQILPLLRRMTYSSETMDNYIFMSSYEGIMLVQPLEPWLQGTYQLDSVDAYGNYYIRDLIEAARSPDGEGFVSYYYPPPGSDNPGRKLSFVKGVPALQCYIGTGMFFNDIDKLFREYLIGPLLFMLLTFAALLILIVFYLRPLFRSFQILVDSFHKISDDPESRPEIHLDLFNEDSDEYEILSGFLYMLDSMRTSRDLLIQADKMASLGVLVAGMAHEINNPNQVILSRASLLDDLMEEVFPILDEYYRENGDFTIRGMEYSEMRETLTDHIRGITGSSRRIGKLVEDLKSLSRETSAHEWTDVDINSVVTISVDLCRSILDTSVNSLELRLADDLPKLRGNGQRLEQVCINLLQNAAQALQDTGGKIFVSTETDPRKHSVILTVRDDGAGIPPDKLKMIFDPFYTTKRDSGGTGLGLSISRSIVRDHGGDILFESVEGEGTTVRVILSCHGNQEKGRSHGEITLS